MMKNSRTNDVLVYIEQRHGELQNVSIELLGIGKTLANKLGGHLNACIIGNQIDQVIEEIGHYGPETIYVKDLPLLENYVNESYTKVLAKAIEQSKPDVVLIGATALGRDLAPRVSSRVHTGLTADCTSLDIDEENQNLLMTRPAFGGNLMATIICPDHRPQMSTVRPGVMIRPERLEMMSSKIVEIEVDITEKDLDVEILEIVYEKKKLIKIEDANVLVSAGRGIGSKEKMSNVFKLAELLKGEVSGTRAVVDNGWLEKDRQVGQTGKTVRPDLYFACGISGAIHHVSGMEESNLIISINRNIDAPIFEVSDIGIVGDVNKILPLLVKELEK